MCSKTESKETRKQVVNIMMAALLTLSPMHLDYLGFLSLLKFSVSSKCNCNNLNSLSVRDTDSFFLEKNIFFLIRCIFQAVYLQSVLTRITCALLYVISSLSVSILKLVQDILTFSWYLSLKQMTRESGHCYSEPLSKPITFLNHMSNFVPVNSHQA